MGNLDFLQSGAIRKGNQRREKFYQGCQNIRLNRGPLAAKRAVLYLTAHLLVQAYSLAFWSEALNIIWLVLRNDVYQTFTLVDHTIKSRPSAE